MASSFPNITNNLFKRVDRIKCKFGRDMMIKNYKNDYNYCDCFVEYTNSKDDLIE